VFTQAALQRLGELRLERACVTRGRCPWAPRRLPVHNIARPAHVHCARHFLVLLNIRPQSAKGA
jgi:hypothetical protein